MGDSPFFQFYPSDWLAGTRGLTASETGIYITLIAMMYEQEGPVQADMQRLARLCGSTPAAFQKAIEGLVETGKLVRSDRGFFNRRVEKELEKRTEKRAAASASAKVRWQKPEQKQGPRHADASASQCETDANQKPEARVVREEGKPSSWPFHRFWADWPHKVAKAAAERAWRKLSEPDRQAATEAIGPWVAWWRIQNPRASPIHPATYLNAKRWLDDIQGAQNAIDGIQRNRPGHRLDPALENIARLAGLGQA